MDEIVGYASKARKSSIISLEEDLEKIDDPFLRKALTLAVDGTDLKELRKMMDLEIFQAEKRAEAGGQGVSRRRAATLPPSESSAR